MNKKKEDQLKTIQQIRFVLKNIGDELVVLQEQSPFVWALETENDIGFLLNRTDLILAHWMSQIQTRNEREEKPK